MTGLESRIVAAGRGLHTPGLEPSTVDKAFKTKPYSTVMSLHTASASETFKIFAKKVTQPR